MRKKTSLNSLTVWWKNKTDSSSLYVAFKCHIKKATSEVGGYEWFRCAVLVLLVVSSADLLAQDKHSKTILFNIPQQQADIALIQFAEQADLTLIVPFDEIEGKIANRLVGWYPIEEAINLLLSNTKLQATIDDETQLLVTTSEQPSGGNKNMKAKNINTKSKWSVGILVALGSLFGGIWDVVAQDSNNDGEIVEEELQITPTPLEEIIIYGSRYRGKQEVAAKREKDVIFDGLSADEIAGVPDFNVADALRRVVGVSAEFDEDEGRFVNIRGIDSNLNRVVFDGITVPTTGSFGGSGRNVNIEFLPSTAVKELEVYKSFNPSLDGSSIGGYVNVKTRSAFDAEDFYFVSKVTVSDYFTDIPFDNDLPIRGEFTTSKLFGSNEQFGIVFTGLYSKRPRDQEKFFGVAPRTGIADSEGAVLPPNRFNVSLYNNDQERFGGNGRIEFRNDDLYSYISGYLYRQEESEVRWVNNVTGFGGNDVSLTSPTTGDITDNRFDVTTSSFPIEKEGRGTHFHIDKVFKEGSKLSFDAGYAKATFDHDTTDANFRFDPDRDPNTAREALDFSYDASALIPTRLAVAEPDLASNPANYYNNFLRFRDLNTDEDILEFKLDFEQNVDSDSTGFGFKTGLGYRELERIRDNNEWRFVHSGESSKTLAELRAEDLVDIADLLSGRTYNSRYQPEPFLFLDPSAVANFFATQGLSPAGTPFDEGISFHEGNSNSSDFSYKEEIASGYIQLAYTADRYRVSGGLRYEDTSFNSIARNDTDSLTDGSYSHILPSINFQYQITESLKLRLGYSESIGRPNPGDLTQAFSTRLANDNDPDGVDLVVTRSNPNLEPRESDNYDLSLEYYFLEGEGLLSAGLFKKDITGDIFFFEEIAEVDGETVLFRQNVNAGKSSVEGLELTFYMGTLNFLPDPLKNLGISANATWLDGESKQIPIGGGDFRNFDVRFRQPDSLLVNTSIFYNSEKFETRLTYNRTDRAVLNTGRAEGDYEQVDASIKYRATDNWHVKLSGRNLLGEPRQQFDDFENFGYNFLFGQTDIDPSYHLSVFYQY